VQTRAYLRYAWRRIPDTQGGGSVLKALSAAEGALPRLRCPVKPRLLPPTLPTGSDETSTVANKPCERIRTQYGTPRRTALTTKAQTQKTPAVL